jgi:GntR family transcriptional regulator
MLWRTKLASGPAPLWFQIAERLRAAIDRGEFAAGDRLPSEADLNREFGVSRTTARAALDRLENDGLIVRKSGRGSIVLPSRVDQPLKALTGFGDDMRERGLTPSYKTRFVRLAAVDEETLTALGLSRGEKALTIERILCADGQPMAISRVTLSPRTLEGCTPPSVADLNSGSLYAWLASHCGVRFTGGVEFIEAAVAGGATARRLGVAAGAPLLVARRSMRNGGGEVVEYSVMHYRADRYRFRLEIGAA